MMLIGYNTLKLPIEKWEDQINEYVKNFLNLSGNNHVSHLQKKLDQSSFNVSCYHFLNPIAMYSQLARESIFKFSENYDSPFPGSRSLGEFL